MRHWTALISGAAGLFAITTVMPAAHAQSVFQKLFGLGDAPASEPRPTVRQIIPPSRFQSRGRWRFYSSRAGYGDEGPPDTSGPYKTMCVRACDGFYFPIRHNARRRNFDSDIKSCRNACGDDAKLFYYPVNDPHGPDGMVDLSGRKYSDLPNSFAYRKALVKSCTCKPAPWSYEEAARHQSYADQEAVELEKDKAFLKARAEAAAAGGNSEPLPTDSAGDAIADANEPADMPALETADVDDSGLDMTSAIYATFNQPAGPLATADTVERMRVSSEPRAVARAFRRRAKLSMQRTSYKIVARRPSGAAYQEPSPGLFDLFGE